MPIRKNGVFTYFIFIRTLTSSKMCVLLSFISQEEFFSDVIYSVGLRGMWHLAEFVRKDKGRRVFM